MIEVDALCKRCGRDIRWACGTAQTCKQCRDEAERERRPDATEWFRRHRRPAAASPA